MSFEYYAVSGRFYESELEAIAMDVLSEPSIGYTYVEADELHRLPEQVILEDDLKAFLQSRYPDLTETELEKVIRIATPSGNTLYEANRDFLRKLSNGFIFNRDDPSKKDILVRLADFNNPEANIFKITNQFEVKQRERRIPDAVVFLNGLPLVVFEFKNPANDIADTFAAYKQVTVRYARDIPRLLGYNAFVVLSDGVNSKYGSAFAPYKFFNTWRTTDGSIEADPGLASFYSLLEGIFDKRRFLSLVKDFIYFPDTLQQDDETKIIARPPQYFAATKLHDNIKEHMKPGGDGKGGTYFGTTGCGKSYTMLFLSRLLMKDPSLKSPTIILITDRTDLDDQLSGQFLEAKTFIGDEEVVQIESREKLRERLQGRESGGVYLTTIQKFTEDTQLLTDRTNVICISDEAHRSQTGIDEKTKVTAEGVFRKYGFAKYLRDSLPNATYVGFTGTPIDDTLNVFGEIVDRYTMVESVRDGFTVSLVYEGRSAYVNLDAGKLREIEDYYTECERRGANEHQIEESKKAMTHLEAIVGDPDRLASVAEDFVCHYETRLDQNATVDGKVLFVCTNRFIAYSLYRAIEKIRPEWTEIKGYDESTLSGTDKKDLKPIAKMNLVMTQGKDDPPDMYDMLGKDDHRKELAKQYKNERSNFKIAIVVDMWLTGFDVPSLDTIYIDKPIQKHNLIQAVSRVNRVHEGKSQGLIVDYIGIKKYLNEALKTYTTDGNEFDGVEKAANLVKDKLELIEMMFKGFDSRPFFGTDPKARLECLNAAAEFIQRDKKTEDRFMGICRDMRQAYRLCATSDLITTEQHVRIDFYIAVRAIVFKLNKGDAPDTAEMNERVSQLLAEAIQSTGVEEVFVTGQDTRELEVDLFDEQYLKRIEAMKLPNTKIKMLERLLKRAIDDFKKVNKIKAVDFSKRLRQIVDNYNDRTADEGDLSDIYEDVTDQLVDLMNDLTNERDSFKDMGIDYEEKAFYDILEATAKKYKFDYPHDKLIDLSRKIKAIVADKSKYTDWSKRADIKASLKVELIVLLDENGYPPIAIDDAYKDVFEQAANFKKYNE